MKHLLVFVSFFLVCKPSIIHAQELEEIKEVNEDELGNVTDQFQELFFKAIKSRAIENYEQALEILQKCLDLDAKEPSIYVEMGKNQIALSNFQKAEKNLIQAIDLLQGEQKIQTQLLLFHVFKDQKKYKEAVKLARTLIDKNVALEEDLIEILMQSGEFSAAIREIEKVEKVKGYSNLTDNFRDAIYKSTNNEAEAIQYYENRKQKNPYNEDVYFRLISFYKLAGNNASILKTAEQLEQINPLQDQLPFIFSMVYVEENQPEKAFQYAEKVFSSNTIDEQAKAQLIEALKTFVVANPAYQSQFLAILDLAIQEGESAASNQERADFYIKRNPAKALEFYQKALEDQPNSFELHQKVIVLQLNEKQHQEAVSSAENALEVFPAQAVFYFLKGKAFFELSQYDDAILVLEEGLDYLFETSQLKIDLLELLAKTYLQKGKNEKSETYKTKALNAKKELDEME